MAMFRKLFYRKPPEGLLEISDRVYVFDCCFTTGKREEGKNYKEYIASIIGQLKDHFPEASFLVFNFRPIEVESLMSNILSEYDMTIMDYPCHYNACPLLSVELVNHFLRSSESWFGLQPQNVILMHCETGGWAVLAFMLAALLLYRNQYTGEQKTLEMVYKQAPNELLPFRSQLNPIPSQLRYLQYVARRNVGSEWPPVDKPLNLTCVIMRFIPNFDEKGGCRPLFRIYGQDPLDANDRNSKLLFETAKNDKAVRSYNQAESEIIKIDINCNLQGDVLLKCFHVNESMEHEKTMFHVMFNTAFIRSNILILNREEVDTLWHTKDNFPKDFRAEILFSDMDAVDSVVKAAISSCFEEKEGLPVEAFAKVQEFFSHVDWLDSRADAALTVLQKISDTHASDKSDEEVNTPKSKLSQSNLKEGREHKPLTSNLADKLESLSIDPSQRKEEPKQSESEASKQPYRPPSSNEKLAQSSITKSFQTKIQPPSPPPPPPPPHLMVNEAVRADTVTQDYSQSLVRKTIESKIQPPPPPPPPPPSQPSSSPSLSSSSSSPSHQRYSVKSESVLPKQTGMPSKPTSSAPPPPPPPKGAVNPGSGNIPAPPPSLKSRGPLRSLGTKNPQTKKLKPLHWMKLNRAVKGSLWAETQKSGETSVYVII